ncbi:hypothetical protein ETAA8_18610 [Anatilimnocola aggregata]|uniref:Secreted protein n=1 Tax=Anatilimnocola aggregata TaxID=2528021 RepID=A0A517Y966_9BACT|nr:hypothetical protein [Anatilimnocola aggregata]QDU26779.1 hypothetical protein ETAA8_18610 [Anatilimnocola aggregata]
MKTASHRWMQMTLAATGLAIVAVANTGCQITEAGQTLPSGYYIQDDIQYFAPGPEFKLQREAAAMKAYKNDLEAQQAARQVP